MVDVAVSKKGKRRTKAAVANDEPDLEGPTAHGTSSSSEVRGVHQDREAASGTTPKGGKKNQNKKRKRDQALGGQVGGRSDSVEGPPSFENTTSKKNKVTTTKSSRSTSRGKDTPESEAGKATKKTKRRKRKGEIVVPATSPVVTAAASAAAARIQSAAIASSDASAPLQLSCTSKVAEYNQYGAGENISSTIGARKTGPDDEHPPRASSSSKKKKKKNKRIKNGENKQQGQQYSREHASSSININLTNSNISRSSGGGGNDRDNGNHHSERDHPLSDDDSHSEISGEPGGADILHHDTLEGIMHGGQMYLVDTKRRVFSIERDDSGEPLQVGTFDDVQRVVVFLKQEACSSPTRGGSGGERVTHEPSVAVTDGAEVGKTRSKQSKKKGKAGGKEDREEGEGGSGGGKWDVETITTSVLGGRGLRNAVDYPFEVEECDHCETSERAYTDIKPLLTALASGLGKPPEELVIYDPYYCQGSTVERLAALGFPKVYNRKENFYEVVENDRVPEHDVVVTNPPFSGDHITKILSFCARRSKPWFLLLPNYVYLKDYYKSSLSRGSGRPPASPFYLTPPKRYMYYSPQGSRLQVKSSERKTSPFNTFWYIRLGDGPVTSKILQSYDAMSRNSAEEARCCIARTTQQIPYKMMDSNDPRRKKARDRQRSIDRIRRKKSEWVVS